MQIKPLQMPVTETGIRGGFYMHLGTGLKMYKVLQDNFKLDFSIIKSHCKVKIYERELLTADR